MMWPCAFKQLWFGDMPLTLVMDHDDPTYTAGIQSGALRYGNLQYEIQQFLQVVLACVSLVIKLRDYGICPKTIALCKGFMQPVEKASLIRRKPRLPPNIRPARPTLLNIAPEIRQNIIRHVVDDVWMTVVCYERNSQDEFSIKRNDRHSLLLTNRRLYREGVNLFYDSLDFHVKAVPGNFSGDLSHFGGPIMRSSVRNMTVGMMDEEVQRTVIGCFENATVTFSDEQASFSRKRAFYFGS